MTVAITDPDFNFISNWVGNNFLTNGMFSIWFDMINEDVRKFWAVWKIHAPTYHHFSWAEAHSVEEQRRGYSTEGEVPEPGRLELWDEVYHYNTKK